jgi:hypothetical protein
MNEKSKKLKELFDKIERKVINDNSFFIETAKNFDISVSLNNPVNENEFSFDNVDEATHIIHDAEIITNRSKADTKNKLVEKCKKVNIDPNSKFTAIFIA